MLARWLLYAGFLAVFANKDFGYTNVSFGMLAAPTLASGGTLGRSWDTGEQKEGHFEVQAAFFFVGRSKDSILRFVWVRWTEKSAFVHACFQVAFSDDFWV